MGRSSSTRRGKGGKWQWHKERIKGGKWHEGREKGRKEQQHEEKKEQGAAEA